jgi:hypothetical protein
LVGDAPARGRDSPARGAGVSRLRVALGPAQLDGDALEGDGAVAVESTFVRITPLAAPAVEAGELADVERVVRAAFAKRRKTLVNSLRTGELGAEHSAAEIAAALVRCAIEPRARAESLEPAQLLALARELR